MPCVITLFSCADIADGGADHFAKTVTNLKERYNLSSLLDSPGVFSLTSVMNK